MLNNFHELFRYKKWANEEILKLGEVSQTELPVGEFRLFVRVMNLARIVDRIFASRLNGQPLSERDANDSENQPAWRTLRDDVESMDAWYLRYLDTLDDAEMDQPIEFRFTDGQAGTLSRAEMLHHVVLHGAYQRGVAGRILMSQSVKPPSDSFSVFLHRFDPSRRW